MLQPRNWCLCRWNSSLVTIWVKWQRHCLRDDILFNTVSFLIIFSCSIHHRSLFSSWCIFALPFSLPKISSSSHTVWSHVWIPDTWFPSPLWNVSSNQNLVRSYMCVLKLLVGVTLWFCRRWGEQGCQSVTTVWFWYPNLVGAGDSGRTPCRPEQPEDPVIPTWLIGTSSTKNRLLRLVKPERTTHQQTRVCQRSSVNLVVPLSPRL